MRRRDVQGPHRSGALGTVLAGASELPTGARGVLERVFWGVGAPRREDARVVVLTPRDAVHASARHTRGGLT